MLHAPSGATVRRDPRNPARIERWALHRLPGLAAGRRRGPSELASVPRRGERGRPQGVLRVRGQPLGPADVASRRQPDRGEPRRRAVSRRAQAPLADRGLAPQRWEPARAHSGGSSLMLALELYRSVTRYAAARVVGERVPGLIAGPLAPLRLVNRDEPPIPGEGWGRVQPRLAGICGSDLATISGRAPFYFSSLVSMPFVPGHEVVGELFGDLEDLPGSTRVVLEPVLSCRARGLEPCSACAGGATGRCDRITVGHVAPGLQTGYCADTGGGWGGMLVAHRSQLRAVPDRMTDARAVLVEPLACAIHAVLRARIEPGSAVLIVGAGTVGLMTLLGLREFTGAGQIVV